MERKQKEAPTKLQAWSSWAKLKGERKRLALAGEKKNSVSVSPGLN